MRRILRSIGSTAAAAGFILAACDEPGPGEPGEPGVASRAVLEGPGGSESGVLLTIHGGADATITAIDGSHRLFSAALPNGDLRVAVVGIITSGPLLGVTHDEGVPSLVLEQVAGPDHGLRAHLDVYELRVE